MPEPTTIHGDVQQRFAAVRDVFADVLEQQGGAGASVAAWYDGQWVVDLWGGWADQARTRPWSHDTIAMPYSVTKAFAATGALMLADRRAIDLDAPLRTYWPELTADATMRQVLSHQAGVVALDEDAPEEAFYDWDLIIGLLERQRPTWPPGTAHGESALFFGHLIGEVVRRVDGRTLGRFLAEEVCAPYDLDFHIGLDEQQQVRAADLVGYDTAFRASKSDPGVLQRALFNPPGALEPAVVNTARWRAAEVPAINGHGTARGVAGLYVALSRRDLLSGAILAQARTEHAHGPDRVLGVESSWGLGFALDPDGFGMGGVGGSVGWWSEVGQYAFGFVTSYIGVEERSDRLENALRAVLDLPPV